MNKLFWGFFFLYLDFDLNFGASTLELLPEWLGPIGLWISVPFAEFLGLLVSVACLLWGRKRYILRPLSRGETGETP